MTALKHFDHTVVIKAWSNQQLLYLILILGCVAGAILSILFGPGTVAPEITPITVGVGFLLLIFEYLYTREVIKRKERPITPGWMVTTIILLVIGLIPEGVVILIASLLWAITLPLLGIYILVLSYILFVKIRDKAR